MGAGPESHIPARQAVTETIKAVDSPYFFSHSKVYSAWETDEIIGHELLRNLLLSLLSVVIITLLLLGNVFVCIIVLVMVIVTLVDIVGFLHFWGITIDILSAVNIVLAIGLCVDYAVKLIGAAVINGGTTTFLALLFCGLSSSHVYQTFFKVFSLTVVFGLFHGLVLLPVVLSILGPSHTSSSSDQSSDAASINTGSMSAGSSRSESPERPIKSKDILEPQ